MEGANQQASATRASTSSMVKVKFLKCAPTYTKVWESVEYTNIATEGAYLCGNPKWIAVSGLCNPFRFMVQTFNNRFHGNQLVVAHWSCIGPTR